METPDDPSKDVAEIEKASTDPVTQLANRGGFEIQARHALVVCRRLRLPATLLFFGVDGIEAMREAGDDAGADRALLAFATAMRKALRGSDVLCHRSGGVFAALLIDCGETATPYILARLRAALAAAGVALEFCSGCAEFLPERHSTIGQLLDDADAELYSQKHARD
jgi:diguanylate cyclase (GGDEF)-like protein